MRFTGIGNAIRYDKEGHFVDDWAGWVECDARSFAEAKITFDKMAREDAAPDEVYYISSARVQHQGAWYNLEDLSEKLGIYLEQDTDLDALVSEMEQAKAESAIEDEYIAMEQRMLRGRK